MKDLALRPKCEVGIIGIDFVEKPVQDGDGQIAGVVMMPDPVNRVSDVVEIGSADSRE